MEEKDFVVSALKYRPSEWAQVVGQDSITSTLTNAIESQELAKAYLFCGPRGVGKTTCARIYAKAINSKYIDDDQDLAFNVFELDAASNNSVDDIRQLIDQVRIQPQLGKYKVYIIDEVHMLSTQAFNAFLKTLEEPPPHAIFILATTEKHKVLPTILSRCQIYDFQRIQVRDIVSHLEKIAIDQGVLFQEEALHLIATKADGALRDALSLFDQMVSFTGKNLEYTSVARNLNVLDHEYFSRIVDSMAAGDVGASLLIYDEVVNKGFDSLLFLIGLAEHLRNVLVAKDQGTIGLLDCPDSVKQDYLRQTQLMDIPTLIAHLDEIQKTEVNYRASKNKRLLTEITLMKLCSSNLATSSEHIPKKKLNVSKPADVVTQPKTTPALETTYPDSRPAISAQVMEAQVPLDKPSQPEKALEKEALVTAGVEENIETNKEIIAPKTEEANSLVKEVVEDNTESVEIEEPSKESVVTNSTKQRRRRGISLADLDIEDDESSEDSYTDAPEKVEGKSIDPVELMLVWKEYAEIIHGQSKFSFHSTLVNRDPEIIDDHTIKVTLENDVQMEHLNVEKADLMSFVREKLDHKGIRLETELDIEDKANIAYRTPREQFQDMMDKNPTLRKMSQQFDLDLDY